MSEACVNLSCSCFCSNLLNSDTHFTQTVKVKLSDEAFSPPLADFTAPPAWPWIDFIFLT